jgi:hypothetical protein
LLKSCTAWKPRRVTRNPAGNLLGQMQTTVLVNVVQDSKDSESETRPGHIIIKVPSQVRLDPFDLCPMVLGQAVQLDPLLGIEVLRTLPVEWEPRRLLDLIRNTPAMMPDVELKDELVECRTQIEQALAHDQRYVFMQRRHILSDVQTVFKAISASLSPSSIRASVAPQSVFDFEHFQVMLCSLEPSTWIIKAARQCSRSVAQAARRS